MEVPPLINSDQGREEHHPDRLDNKIWSTLSGITKGFKESGSLTTEILFELSQVGEALRTDGLVYVKGNRKPAVKSCPNLPIFSG